jgi:GMP synthase (glutamine-hydrolysing)
MAKEILVIRNTPRENPGILESLMIEHKLNYNIIDFDESSVIKPVEDYAALIVLGGPESANDKTPKMIRELATIRKAVDLGLPYIGICLGLQIFVKSLNGTVSKCKTPEVGFRDPSGKIFKIRLTAEGRKDKLFNNLPDEFKVFQLHGETVELTPEMTLLATGDYCRNQIVKYGEKAYGIQSHFELTDELLGSWLTEDDDLKKHDSKKIIADFEIIKAEYQKTGRCLFENFLSIARLI